MSQSVLVERAGGIATVILNAPEKLNALSRGTWERLAEVVTELSGEDALRTVILERFDLSLGTGLGKVKGKVFRIGHLGDFNELMLAGTLCGVEMGLGVAGVPHQKGGVDAALRYLADPEGGATEDASPARASA